MSKGKGQALGSIFGAGRAAGRPEAARPGAPAAAAATPPVAAFLAVVDRLEAVLDAETDALTRDLSADIAELGNRKRQGLLEMSRTLRAVAAGGSTAEVRARLGRFSMVLERNRATLGAQLRAAREIADIVASTLRDAESDGTYSSVAGRPSDGRHPVRYQ